MERNTYVTLGSLVARITTVHMIQRVPTSTQAQVQTQKSEEDRTLQQPVEAQTQDQSGQVDFQESANVEHQELPGNQLLKLISNPFPDQTPKRVLERSYLVAQFVWSPSTTAITLAFPETLFSISTISQYLSIFKYIRAGVQLIVRMNSTPYHQGSLVASWIPCRDGASSGLSTYQRVNARPVVLSASVQDSCTLDYPYVNPLSWLDISTCANYAQGTFMLYTLNTLLTTSASIPTSVDVTIWARFTDCEVAGYLEPVDMKKRRKPLAQAQSSRQPRGKALGVVDYAKKAKEDTVKEAEDKEDKGVAVKGIQKIVGGASEIIKMIPVIGPFYKPIAEFISTFGKVLDLPISDTAICPANLNNNAKYEAQVSGLFEGKQLTMYPGVQTSKENFSMESSSMTLLELARTPGLHLTTSFANSGDSATIGVQPMAPSSYAASVDFLGYVTAAFGFWRGSLKYLFHFVNSAFYSARFRIGYASSNPTVVDGDLPQLVIDVKGDTWTEVTIPYLHPLVWRPTGNSQSTSDPKLYITMITEISGSSAPASPLIYLNVWRSAGEDFQLKCMKNAYSYFNPGMIKKPSEIKYSTSERIPLSQKVIAQAQTDITTRFKQPFKPIAPASNFTMEFRTCEAELPIHISDCMKRWSDVIDTDTANTQGWDVKTSAANGRTNCEPFYYWSECFLFWKGSRRIRALGDTADVIYLQAPGSATATSAQGVIYTTTNLVGSSPFVRQTSYEIPWDAEVPYSYTDRLPTIPSTAQFDPPLGSLKSQGSPFANDTSLQIAAGDDFQYLYVFPPGVPPA